MSQQNGRQGRLTQEQLASVITESSVRFPDSLRNVLEAHFEPTDIRSYGESDDGRKLTSIDPTAIIRRLNDCFGGTWSFDIEEHNVLYDAMQVIVKVKLSCQHFVKDPAGQYHLVTTFKSAIGNSGIRINQGQQSPTGHLPQMFNLGWDVKSAATDGLKKAASLFGVGLFLYEKDGVVAGQPPQPQQQPQHQQTQPQQAAPQVAPKFQVDQIVKFFEGLGYPREQWTAFFGFSDPYQISIDFATSIMNGTHPVIADFQQKTGNYINPGLKASAAK